MKRNHSKPAFSLQSKTFALAALFCILFGTGAYANNIAIANVTPIGQSTSGAANTHYTMVQFDISWANSFRVSTGPSNWDAAWMFVKYRVSVANGGDGLWRHATLNTSGFTAPTGSSITAATDGTGAFIYMSADGRADFNKLGVQLRWNYGLNTKDGVTGIGDNDLVDIQVFAIEMLWVPQGAFAIGTGGTETSAFTLTTINTGSATLTPAGVGTLGGQAGGYPTGATLPTSSTFSNGFNGFYCMKYEVSQKGYVDFLNTLTYTQQAGRVSIAPSSSVGTYINGIDNKRNKIKIGTPGTASTVPAVFTAEFTDVACNWLSWGDLAAYLDWSGLRPMTELEYEKACRGTLAPVANEYIWGGTTIATAEYTISSGGSPSEVINDNYSTTLGNAAYATTDLVTGINGPVRVGIFAGTSGNNGRRTAGATYNVIMEMGGNVSERVVALDATGKAFTGVHGDGRLDANGDAVVTNWPDVMTAAGIGFRGGNWQSSADFLRISDRADIATVDATRTALTGGRGVRIP